MITSTAIPLSLYVHLPWCIRKCPYCDFNSHALKQNLPEKTYIDALLKDLAADHALVGDRPITSIFFGGGTPSLFSAPAIQAILDGIRAQVCLSPNAEITLEANPGTLEQGRFAQYREAGVNRLSIGVQSFNHEKLKLLGRIHDSQQAIKAAHTARAAGFDNFNIDLMHGLPTQTITDAMEDLQQAFALLPTHISWYQLTLEPNTLFYTQPPSLPSEDVLWDIQTQGQQLLAEQGFIQYEVSAYSQLDKRCQHNLNYWQFGDYLGIGAGAHSKITLADGSITRITKTKHPKDYLNITTPFISEQRIITQTELPFEFMLNALRLHETLAFTLFIERTGLNIEVIKTTLQHAATKGLVEYDNHFLWLTAKGRLFIDEITQLFLV